MLTHHLTITQNKFFYISHDIKSIYIPEGLNPQDAKNYGLIPVLAITLSVEGASIYHQKLFVSDEPVSLTNFLYEAWTNNHLLGGLPDILHTDKHLVDEFPLHDVIKKLDPNGHVKQIVTKHNAKFGANKAQAHNQIAKAILRADQYLNKEVASKEEMLDLINEAFFAYSKDIIPLNINEDKIKRKTVKETLDRARNLPEYIENESDRQLFTGSWVSQAAFSTPLLSETQSLVVSSAKNWLECLHIYNEDEEITSAIKTDTFYRSENYRWAEDLYGLDDTIKSLPFNQDQILPVDVSDQSFKNFLSEREPLTTHAANLIRDNIFGLPMILFPKNTKMLKGAYEYISNGGDFNRVFEVYCPDLPDSNYRVVFGEVCYDNMFAIIIKKGTNSYHADLKKVLINFDGKIDIGPAGMTCILYWIEQFYELKSVGLYSLFVEMLERMLNSSSTWISHE